MKEFMGKKVDFAALFFCCGALFLCYKVLFFLLRGAFEWLEVVDEVVFVGGLWASEGNAESPEVEGEGDGGVVA